MGRWGELGAPQPPGTQPRVKEVPQPGWWTTLGLAGTPEKHPVFPWLHRLRESPGLWEGEANPACNQPWRATNYRPLGLGLAALLPLQAARVVNPNTVLSAPLEAEGQVQRE